MGFDPAEGETDSDRGRARRIAAATEHAGVTEDLLVGGGRFSGTFYLHDASALAYLDSDERPAFGFFNHVRGVGVDDDPGRHEPDTHGIAIVLLTDRRVIALVGAEDGDHEVSLHYDVVTGVGYEVGDLHHRLTVETAREAYHLWISRQFDAEELRAAAEFVRERLVDPDRLLDGGSTGDDAGEGGSVASDGGDPDAPGPAGAPETAGTTGRAPETPVGEGDPLDGEGDPLARIERLHSLLEAGAISRSEYERKKADLLDRV